MINNVTRPASISKGHHTRVAVELMDRETRLVLKRDEVNTWRSARLLGAQWLKEAENKNTVVRIYNPDDVSDYDFITRERLAKSKGISFDKNGKEIKNNGSRKVDRYGQLLPEWREADSNREKKRISKGQGKNYRQC